MTYCNIPFCYNCVTDLSGFSICSVLDILPNGHALSSRLFMGRRFVKPKTYRDRTGEPRPTEGKDARNDTDIFASIEGYHHGLFMVEGADGSASHLRRTVQSESNLVQTQNGAGAAGVVRNRSERRLRQHNQRHRQKHAGQGESGDERQLDAPRHPYAMQHPGEDANSRHLAVSPGQAVPSGAQVHGVPGVRQVPHARLDHPGHAQGRPGTRRGGQRIALEGWASKQLAD